MSQYAIQVEGLGKEYIIGGAEQRHDSFREMLTGSLTAPFRKFRKLGGAADEEDRFWALWDVSFSVRPGEVIGIIGRNGAGKSTLLKILSRISAPSQGHIVSCGRVGSLLEVGTGFHPELTGRENIFLNGAILGMSRMEIQRQFEEIVEFAQIQQFLDTPVKRYSSGMYVRLAFSVAAHLNPEILLVDEVLAVGDVEFQKKCLRKLGQVSNEGRTVLFVSHNLQAVKLLCHRSILLDKGQVRYDGETPDCIAAYLELGAIQQTHEWSCAKGLGDDNVRLTRLTVRQCDSDSEIFTSDKDIEIGLETEIKKPIADLCIGFDLFDEMENVVFRSYQTDQLSQPAENQQEGKWYLNCRIPAGMLNGGSYRVAPRLSAHNRYWIVNTEPLITFDLVLAHGKSPYWASLSRGARPGAIAWILDWKIDSI
jgi:lipopolysaccharide transport system ATP-binding protein